MERVKSGEVQLRCDADSDSNSNCNYNLVNSKIESHALIHNEKS